MLGEIKIFRGNTIKNYVQNIATISNIVYREFPYFYDVEETGDFYIQRYTESKDAILCLAFEKDKIIGYAIGVPLKDYPAFQKPFLNNAIDVSGLYYLGEFALLNNYRGNEIGANLILTMEAEVQKEKIYNEMCLLHIDENSIENMHNTPLLSTFWAKFEYKERPDLFIELLWKNVGSSTPSSHRLIYWTKKLMPITT